MRIAYIGAGAADMYCGSCLHDNTLAAALMDLGEDVVLVPIYTPLRTDEPDVSQRRIFFGGINVYLQQKWALFRHTPWWLDRLLDQPEILSRITKGGVSVDPTKLGDMTVSMLAGEDGNQRKELEKLVHWLHDELRPDVVHLSNSMLLGLARRIKQQGGMPVVCQLSGEDLFLEKLPAPFYERARMLLRERAADVDAFVANNRYYADFMADYLAVDRARIVIIPHGLRLEGHGQRREKRPDQAHTVGFLARICEDKGLHLLVEACEHLATRDGLGPIKLRTAGYLAGTDRPYLDAIRERVKRGHLAGRFEYLGEVDRVGKIEFLQSLDVFSVPTVYRESKGLPALEAMANGVPLVLPDHGAFSELIGDTGAGLLHRPHAADDLADKLEAILRQPDRGAELGRAGQRAIHDRYHAGAMARKTLALYRNVVGGNVRA